MRFEQLRDGWNRLGTIDPMWAVLTHADKLGNRWEEAEFFNTGKLEVEAALEMVTSLVGRVASCRALDFGCGVGRLSRALSEHFAEVIGVDVAATMIDRARSLNRYPERCSFLLNERPDLALLEDRSFDFIYSSITLQHMAPKQAKRYIAEFSRLLKVGGILLFQVPLPMPVTPRYLIHRILIAAGSFVPLSLMNFYRNIRHRKLGKAFMKDAPQVLMVMNGLSRKAIEASFTAHKMICVDARRREDAGPGWKTYTYAYMRIGSAASTKELRSTSPI